MTTGQKLAELSGLASGSALAHLLAITQGTGAGTDKIIFASQMMVCMETPSLILVEGRRASAATQQFKEPAVSSKEKRLDVYTPQNSLVTNARVTRLFVVSRHTAECSVLLRKNSAVAQKARKVVSL